MYALISICISRVGIARVAHIQITLQLVSNTAISLTLSSPQARFSDEIGTTFETEKLKKERY